MSVGPEALRRFGPCCFSRARGAGLLCVPHGCSGLLCAPVGGGPPARRPRHEPSARRVVSKPGQAPPPPTGPAARPTDSSGTLHTSGACRYCAYPIQAPPPPTSTTARPTNSSGTIHTGGVCPFCAYPIQAPPPPTSTTADPPIPAAPSTPVGLWWLTLIGASSRSPSRPHRRPRAPQPGPPIPPAHSTPVGLWWLTLLGASSRSPARPRRRPPAPQQALPIVPCSLHRWRWDFTELGAGCRRAGVLMMQNSRLVVVKPRREAVWRSKCRPPRSKTPKMGC